MKKKKTTPPNRPTPSHATGLRPPLGVRPLQELRRGRQHLPQLRLHGLSEARWASPNGGGLRFKPKKTGKMSRCLLFLLFVFILFNLPRMSSKMSWIASHRESQHLGKLDPLLWVPESSVEAWILLGFWFGYWMDFAYDIGWILVGYWLDFGWILVGFWLDVGLDVGLDIGWILLRYWLGFASILVGFWLDVGLDVGLDIGWILLRYWLGFASILVGFWLDIGWILVVFWLDFGLILVGFCLGFGSDIGLTILVRLTKPATFPMLLFLLLSNRWSSPPLLISASPSN